MNKTKVLFLCTGNSARSQMAEAYLRKYAGDRFDVHSAGLEPKGIHPLTRQVLEEAGLDISQQTSKDLKQYLGHVTFGYLITVCANAEKRCPIFPGVSMRLHWPFDDPAAFEGSPEERLAKFRDVRDQIDRRIQVWLTDQGWSLAPNSAAAATG
jgi:arsenate reductase